MNNEFETKSLGKLKILAHIDNIALLEKLYNAPEKYIIATNFDVEQKSWASGSYYEDFKDVLEEFTERILSARDLRTSKQKTIEKLYDLSTRVSEVTNDTNRVTVRKYLNNEKELERLRVEFKKSTINDNNLREHFKNDNPSDRFANIKVAGSILAGIELRNIQRASRNLKGDKEEFPYTEEQIKMIDRYTELENEQEEIEYSLEESEEEDMEM